MREDKRSDAQQGSTDNLGGKRAAADAPAKPGSGDRRPSTSPQHPAIPRFARRTGWSIAVAARGRRSLRVHVSYRDAEPLVPGAADLFGPCCPGTDSRNDADYDPDLSLDEDQVEGEP